MKLREINLAEFRKEMFGEGYTLAKAPVYDAVRARQSAYSDASSAVIGYNPLEREYRN